MTVFRKDDKRLAGIIEGIADLYAVGQGEWATLAINAYRRALNTLDQVVAAEALDHADACIRAGKAGHKTAATIVRERIEAFKAHEGWA